MYKVSTEQVTLVTEPTVEPVTLTEAKAHLRVDITDDDTLIGSLITAAREYVEIYTGRSYAIRTYRADLSGFADVMSLPYAPIMTVDSIKYYDTASPSVQQTLSSDVYSLVNDVIYRNSGEAWESVYPRMDAVQITYTAGSYTTDSPQVDQTPKAIEQSILLIVGDLYENREGKIIGTIQSDNPTVKALLHSYRLYR